MFHQKREKLIFYFLIVLDQTSKFVAHALHLVQINPGISFGLRVSNMMIYVIFLMTIMIIFFEKKYFSQIPYFISFFLAGIFSNILDRCFFSGVRDFIFVPILMIKNNLADFYILISCLLVIIHLIKYEFKRN